MPTKQVGLLHTGSETVFGPLVQVAIAAANTWLQGNNHQDINVELHADRTRYADDDLDQLEDDADELIERNSNIILAAGGPQSAIAARDATAEAKSAVKDRIPVIFTTVVDPVDIGLRESCDVPGGTNLTGMAGRTSETDPMRLSILHQFLLVQGRVGTLYGVLVNPSREKNRKQFQELKKAARLLGVSLVRRRASKLGAIRKAYAFFRRKNVAGVVVTADAFFNNNRQKIIAEAAPALAPPRAGVPTIYQWKEFTDNFTENGVAQNGGLISFGPDMTEAYTKAGEYVGRVAAGTLPSDIKCSTPDENLIQIWVNDDTATALQLDLTKIPAQLSGKDVNRRP